MSKKDDKKMSPFGLPSFKDEQKELDKGRKEFYDRLPSDLKKKVDELRKKNK